MVQRTSKISFIRSIGSGLGKKISELGMSLPAGSGLVIQTPDFLRLRLAEADMYLKIEMLFIRMKILPTGQSQPYYLKKGPFNSFHVQ